MTFQLPQEKFEVPVEGGHLALFRFGPASGGAPVLLIHGVTSSNRAWTLLAPHLIEMGYVPYAVDLRGRADSNQLPGPFGMPQHAKDMVAVVDYLGVEKLNVIGHSMGAFVTVALAGLYPERVDKAILVDGGIPLPLPPGMTVEQVMPFVLGPALARLAMTFDSNNAYREYWKPQPAFNKGWSDALDAYVDYDLRGDAPEMRASTNAKAVEEDSRDLFANDLIERTLESLAEDLPFIRAQRGLQNEEAGLYPLAVLEAVLPKYPKLKVTTLEDTNHYDILLEESGAARVAQEIAKVWK